MVHSTTKKAQKVQKAPRICLKLTTSQKAARHEKFESLMEDVNGARDAYHQEVQSLSKKTRTVT
jgi:hypothetical protein